MKLKLTDSQIIARNKCERKGCPNKASALYENRFLCEEHNKEENPKASDKKLERMGYVNYQRHLR